MMEQKAIDEVFTIIRGISFPKTARSEEASEYVGCLRTANIQKEILWSDVWRIPKQYLNRQEQLIKKDDIIVSIANSLNLLGKSAIVTNTPNDCTFGTFIVSLRPKDGYFPRYLYYTLQSEKYYRQVKSLASTTTNISNLSTAKLKTILLPIPSLAGQERIATRIDELFSELDAGVETLQKTKQQLAVYRQAVLKDAFAAFTVKEPISRCSSLVTSGSRGWAQYYADTGSRFIRITDLTRDRIALQNKSIQLVSLPDSIEGKRSRLEPKDVLISITADLGSIALVPDDIGDAYINQHIAVVRFLNPSLGVFMAWYLKSDYGQKELLQNKRGNGKLGLGLDDVRQTAVPVVDNITAQKTVEFIENHLSICDDIEKTVDEALQRSAAMRQSILKQAFEGGM